MKKRLLILMTLLVAIATGVKAQIYQFGETRMIFKSAENSATVVYDGGTPIGWTMSKDGVTLTALKAGGNQIPEQNSTTGDYQLYPGNTLTFKAENATLRQLYTFVSEDGRKNRPKLSFDGSYQQSSGMSGALYYDRLIVSADKPSDIVEITATVLNDYHMNSTDRSGDIVWKLNMIYVEIDASSSPTIHDTEIETTCDYFNWHGSTYTTSGEYQYEEKDTDGNVTDIYTLQLTIYNSTTETWEREVYMGQHFEEYPFDFVVTAETELTQTATGTNAQGCDNVITLKLTIVKGPGISVAETEHNFGEVAQGAVAKKDITVTNSADFGVQAKVTVPGGFDWEKMLLFTNNLGWGKVFLYVWDAEGTPLVGQWPGTELMQHITNGYGQQQFIAPLPMGAAGIIFNDGNNRQTVDITSLDVEGYYPIDSKDVEGRELVSSWGTEPTFVVPANGTGTLTVYMDTKTTGTKKGTMQLTPQSGDTTPIAISLNGSVVHVHSAADPVEENVTPATCEGEGSFDMVVYCSTCGEELSREQMHTEALGHNWGDATYDWATDNSKVTAKHVCSRDATHEETETVQPTSEETKAPTETEPGEMTYTATFTTPGFTTQTKKVEIPACTTYDVWIAGMQVTSNNAGDLSVVDGVSGTINYDAATNTLTLGGVTITGTDAETPIIRWKDNLIVDLVEGTTNTLGTGGENGPKYCVEVYGDEIRKDLTIQGPGVLNLKGTKDVVSCDGNIFIKNGATVNVTLNTKFKIEYLPGGGTSYTWAYESIFCSNTLTLDGASLNVDAVLTDVTKDGIFVEGIVATNLTVQNNATLEISTSGGSTLYGGNFAISLYEGNVPTLTGNTVAILEGNDSSSATSVEELTNVYNEPQDYFQSKPYVKVTTTATGINSLSMDNGQRTTDGHWYDLNGRRLIGEPTQHGLYIYNGKKVKK